MPEQEPLTVAELQRRIEVRLDQLQQEAVLLKQALSEIQAIGAGRGSAGTTTRRNAPAKPKSPNRPRRSRRASGSLREDVLAALNEGGDMTAAGVAQATGLERASVSTMLSRLAKLGEIEKAERGYRFAYPAAEAGNMPSDESEPADDAPQPAVADAA